KRALKGIRSELLFLFWVGDEAHFDEHGWHVGADEHAERGLLNRPRTHRHARAQAAFDQPGEQRRLLDVARLRHLPEDDFDIARASAKYRQCFSFALRNALRFIT